MTLNLEMSLVQPAPSGPIMAAAPTLETQLFAALAQVPVAASRLELLALSSLLPIFASILPRYAGHVAA